MNLARPDISSSGQDLFFEMLLFFYSACLEKESLCNCDGREGTSDWGAFTDKETLPVTKVVFEKPAAEQGQDKLKVGQFECIGDQSEYYLKI